MPGHLSDPPMTELVLDRGRDRHCDVTSVSVYFGYIYYNAAGKLESFFQVYGNIRTIPISSTGVCLSAGIRRLLMCVLRSVSFQFKNYYA